MELKQLRLLVVAMVGREQVGCACGSGQYKIKWRKTMREMLRRAHLSLGETGRKEMGRKEKGREETGRR